MNTMTSARNGKNVGIWFEEYQDANEIVGGLVANSNPYGTRVWTTKWFTSEEIKQADDIADVLCKVHHHFLMVVNTFLANEHAEMYDPELLLEVIGPNNICGWISSYDVSFHDNNS
jgi:hypothetical protein